MVLIMYSLFYVVSVIVLYQDLVLTTVGTVTENGGVKSALRRMMREVATLLGSIHAHVPTKSPHRHIVCVSSSCVFLCACMSVVGFFGTCACACDDLDPYAYLLLLSSTHHTVHLLYIHTLKHIGCV